MNSVYHVELKKTRLQLMWQNTQTWKWCLDPIAGRVGGNKRVWAIFMSYGAIILTLQPGLIYLLFKFKLTIYLTSMQESADILPLAINITFEKLFQTIKQKKGNSVNYGCQIWYWSKISSNYLKQLFMNFFKMHYRKPKFNFFSSF